MQSSLQAEIPIDFKYLCAATLMVKNLCKSLGTEPFGQVATCCPEQPARCQAASC